MFIGISHFPYSARQIKRKYAEMRSLRFHLLQTVLAHSSSCKVYSYNA